MRHAIVQQDEDAEKLSEESLRYIHNARARLSSIAIRSRRDYSEVESWSEEVIREVPRLLSLSPSLSKMTQASVSFRPWQTCRTIAILFALELRVCL